MTSHTGAAVLATIYLTSGLGEIAINLQQHKLGRGFLHSADWVMSLVHVI
ncbi:MAG: hypothetical protein ACR5LD_02725 [Symbiopectobacterium sp.]